MQTNLGLKFKKMKTLAARANSVCCLYQRQQFAITLIKLMMSGKRILNVDEANLNQATFVRKGWGISAAAMRHVTKPLGYRLTLTAGVDTNGRSYFAVSQQGNESRLFGTFLLRLASCLDAEDPDWRENTILLLDGCSYHRS